MCVHLEPTAEDCWNTSWLPEKPVTLQCWGKWRHDMWGKYVPALLRPYTEAYYMYDVLLSYLHYALQKQYQQKEREK